MQCCSVSHRVTERQRFTEDLKKSLCSSVSLWLCVKFRVIAFVPFVKIFVSFVV